MARKKTDREILIARDRDFVSALDHPTWRDWREDALKCFRYKEGDQWTAAERAELKERGQPDTVNNQVKVTLDRLVGQFTRFRTNIAFRGRNSPEDDAPAQVLTDLVRYIQQFNQIEYEERDLIDDAFTCGFGAFEVFVTFDDALEPEIIVRSVDTLGELFPDPHSRRYDWNEDAAYVCRARWIDMSEAIARWPDKTKELKNIESSSDSQGLLASVETFENRHYIDLDHKGRVRRIRPVQEWYKQYETETLTIARDREGQPVTLTEDEFKAVRDDLHDPTTIVRTKPKLYSCTWIGGTLLERPRESSHGTRFPYVPYFVERKKNGEPYSLVLTALSIQDAINKRESKALHLLTANQAIYERGAVTDKDQLALEVAKPDGQIELNSGYFEKFLLNKNIDLAVSQFQMHQEAKADFRRVTGVNPDALGEKSEVRSGVGIARKQAMTEFITARLFDNFRRTRSLLARLLLDFITAYYTAPKIALITDDLGAAHQLILDPNTFAAIKQSTYDIVVDEAPDATTRQEEQFQTITQLLPQILPFGSPWVQLLLQMSAIRDKSELIEQIGQMSAPPPPEPRVSVSLTWDALTPEERVAWSMRLGMPELAQAQQTSAPSSGQRDLAKIQADLGIAERKTDVEIEKIKGQNEAKRRGKE